MDPAQILNYIENILTMKYAPLQVMYNHLTLNSTSPQSLKCLQGKNLYTVQNSISFSTSSKAAISVYVLDSIPTCSFLWLRQKGCCCYRQLCADMEHINTSNWNLCYNFFVITFNLKLYIKKKKFSFFF